MTVRYSSVSWFSQKLLGAPKDARREIRKTVRSEASDLLQDVRRAASWSRRIPAATQIKVAFGKRTAGVRIAVNQKRAPHAKVHEFPNKKPQTIRHPVFGDMDDWVEQPAHPFFRKTVRAKRRTYAAAIEKAIDGVLDKLT